MADDARTAFVRAMVNEGTNDADITAALKVYDAQHPASAMDTALDVGKGFLKGVGASAANVGDLMVKSGMFPGSTPALPSPLIEAARQATTATNTAQMVGKGLETATELAPGTIGIARAVPNMVRGALATPAAGELADALTSNPASLLTQARQMLSRKLLGNILDWAKTPPAQRAVDTTVADTLQDLQKLSSTWTGDVSGPLPQVASPSGMASVQAAAPVPIPAAVPTAPMATPATPQALPSAWAQFAKPASFPPKEIEGSGLAAAFDQELAKRGAAASDAILAVKRNPALTSDMRTQLVSALEKVARKQAGVTAPSMTDPTLPAAWQAFIQK